MSEQAKLVINEENALATTLRQLGFTDIEARTYETLARIQPATAYEIAKRAGLPRANVYNAVSVLLSRDALQPVTEAPVRYVLSNPDSFFRRLSIDTSRNAEAASAAVKKLAPQEETPFVSFLRGREALVERLTQLFSTAKKHILIKTTDELAMYFAEPLIEAAKRGIAVKIVASGRDWEAFEDVPNVTLVPHEGTWSTPSKPHAMLLTTTVDSEALIIAIFGKAPYGYIAPNSGLVYVIQTMILHEIYLAEIYLAIGPEALDKAGANFTELRKRFRPPGIERGLLDEAERQEKS